MPEEVKPKTTKAKASEPKVEEVAAVEEVVVPVEPKVELIEETLPEPTPEPEPPVEPAPVSEPEPKPEDVEVEAMGKRGRKSKAELAEQYKHEFETKLSNEPQFEVQFREELAEKLAKLK